VIRVGDLPPVSSLVADQETLGRLHLLAGIGARVSLTILDSKRRELGQITYTVSEGNILLAKSEVTDSD